jgi:hypothetical protein
VFSLCGVLLVQVVSILIVDVTEGVLLYAQYHQR